MACVILINKFLMVFDSVVHGSKIYQTTVPICLFGKQDAKKDLQL